MTDILCKSNKCPTARQVYRSSQQTPHPSVPLRIAAKATRNNSTFNTHKSTFSYLRAINPSTIIAFFLKQNLDLLNHRRVA